MKAGRRTNQRGDASRTWAGLAGGRFKRSRQRSGLGALCTQTTADFSQQLHGDVRQAASARPELQGEVTPPDRLFWSPLSVFE